MREKKRPIICSFLTAQYPKVDGTLKKAHVTGAVSSYGAGPAPPPSRHPESVHLPCQKKTPLLMQRPLAENLL